MITKEQAIALGNGELPREIHYGSCRVYIGPRGGVRYFIRRWRVSGKCKTWKTRPDEFRLPIKSGFRGPHGYITHRNCGDFHLVEDCSNNTRKWEYVVSVYNTSKLEDSEVAYSAMELNLNAAVGEGNWVIHDVKQHPNNKEFGC